MHRASDEILTAGSSEETTPCLTSRNTDTMKTFISNCTDGRLITLDILFMIFGIGAWVGINGIYNQLPLLVATAPESWNLPSFMAVVIQIANIGPIAYSILRKLYSRNKDHYYIYFILLTGTTSMILMAFLYQVTTKIAGESRSTVFLILIFFVSLVGCTSSVLFYPYLRHFRDIYLISYLIGEGLSGFLPSILALSQGVGGHPECNTITLPDGNSTVQLIYPQPRFSTKLFFILLSALLLLSLIAFTILHNLKAFNSERVNISVKKEEEINERHGLRNGDHDKINFEEDAVPTLRISRLKFMNLLLLMAIICGLGNGVFPSIQTYSCLPFGNTVYHLSVTLSSMANPVACFLAVFLPHTSNRAITSLTCLLSLVVSYTLATALLSPSPPLVGTIIGSVLVVASWILAVAFVSYIKLCIATIFRGQGENAMFYCGAVSQLGSAIGSLLFFFLINYANIFTQSDPCH